MLDDGTADGSDGAELTRMQNFDNGANETPGVSQPAPTPRAVQKAGGVTANPGPAQGGGVAQGQRPLNRCSGNDFQHEVFVPTTTAAFHDKARAVGMLFQQ